jgi:hypothetical protein
MQPTVTTTDFFRSVEKTPITKKEFEISLERNLMFYLQKNTRGEDPYKPLRWSESRRIIFSSFDQRVNSGELIDIIQSRLQDLGMGGWSVEEIKKDDFENIRKNVAERPDRGLIPEIIGIPYVLNSLRSKSVIDDGAYFIVMPSPSRFLGWVGHADPVYGIVRIAAVPDWMHGDDPTFCLDHLTSHEYGHLFGYMAHHMPKTPSVIGLDDSINCCMKLMGSGVVYCEKCRHGILHTSKLLDTQLTSVR